MTEGLHPNVRRVVAAGAELGFTVLHGEVWAAAGTPNVNFAIAPPELVRVTRGAVCDLARP
ncbi:MAG TPA: hypothetical protein VGV63_01265 [Acidimicrobiales bacterium]|nr:hypothetical protein [Acidimicrobiales bacterium]